MRRYLPALLIAALILAYAPEGRPALEWMRIYSRADVALMDGSQALDFVLAQRTGLAPFWTALEVLLIQLGIPFAWYTQGFLWLALWGLACLLIYNSTYRWSMTATCIIVMHAYLTLYSAQDGYLLMYDVLTPLVLLGAWLALKHRAPIAAGLLFSIFELTRPFGIILLPVFLLASYQLLRPRQFVWMLVPIVLLSGLWHVQLYARFGQIIWTNHSGNNLIRAWQVRGIPEVHIPDAFMQAQGFRARNINTDTHYENNQVLAQAVLTKIIERPLWTLKRAVWLMLDVLQVKTELPVGVFFLPVYRALVMLLFVAMAWHAWKMQPYSHLQWLNLLTIVGMVALAAWGEYGEETRFTMQFVPLMLWHVRDGLY